ncbi:MAG: LON peptidase substrate-binding domain-containing protein, partial [Candidatus Aminicenantales bacterium]
MAQLDNKNGEPFEGLLEETSQKLHIPTKLPVLLLRDTVIFPYMIAPLFVGREKSKNAIDQSLSTNRMILLLTQKDVEIEEPKREDVYDVGTVALIMRMLKLPDGRIRILAQGLTRPLTPMGLAAFRLIASSVAGAAGFDVPEPHSGPRPYTQAGQRIFFDLTAVVRSATGRAIVPRVFDVMEARSAAVLRRLFADPRFSITSRSPWGLLRHVGPVVARTRV